MATHIKNWTSKRGLRFADHPIHCTNSLLDLLRQQGFGCGDGEYILSGSFKKRGPSLGITIASMLAFGQVLRKYGVIRPSGRGQNTDWYISLGSVNEIYHELEAQLKRNVCGQDIPPVKEGRIAILRRELVQAETRARKADLKLWKLECAIRDAGIRY